MTTDIRTTCELTGPALEYTIRRLKKTTRDPRPYGRLIELEGLDGVGKTTIANALAERFNVVTLASPINEVARKTRKSIDTLVPMDPDKRFRFYEDKLHITHVPGHPLDTMVGIIRPL